MTNRRSSPPSRAASGPRLRLSPGGRAASASATARSSATRSSAPPRARSTARATTTPRSTTSPPRSKSPSPPSTTTSRTRSSCCSSASWRASSRIRAAFREVRRLELPARERLNAVLRHYARGRGVRVRLVHGARRDQDLCPAMSAPHQGTEVGDRPGHPPAAARGHAGRLDPSLRSEDDRVRAGRRAELDRALVPRGPVA